MSKETPILFSAPMVRAILEGRKTQTRRIVRDPHGYPMHNPMSIHKMASVYPAAKSGWVFWYPDHEGLAEFTKQQYETGLDCPYGGPGDLLWVKETWGYLGQQWDSNRPEVETIFLKYWADESKRDLIVPNGEADKLTPKQNGIPDESVDRLTYCEWIDKWWERQKKKSARFMPKWAARIWLEITGRRLVRVQDISEEDAIAEGLIPLPDGPIPELPEPKDRRREIYPGERACEQYVFLWDSINAKRGYRWDANPWVWVVEFKLRQMPERSAK